MIDRYRLVFADCDRCVALLARLLDGPPAGRPGVAADLFPLLADLGDVAADHGVDDGPLCAARASLNGPAERWAGEPFAATVGRAVVAVGRVRGAVRLHARRRLWEVSVGAWTP